MKKDILFLLMLAFAISSMTLWLLESPLKYILYFFEVTLILILYYSLCGESKKTIFEIKGNMTSKIDFAFLVVSAVLFASTVLGLNSVLNMVCAIVVSFFLPGYVLLRLLKFRSLNTWLEWLVVAFGLSIGPTSLITTFVLPFAAYRATFMSAMYLGISLFPLLRDWTNRSRERLQVSKASLVKGHDLFDTLLLVWVSLLFIFIISNLYPQMAYRLGLDIVDHFSSFKLLMSAPHAYTAVYPWFHLTWASVYELSKPPMEVFQTGLAYLSLIVVFAFYIMAKAYLKDVDRSAPIVATIFFSVFSGLGWLDFLGDKLTAQDSGGHLNILHASSDTSYWDIGYGQGPWIWLWFRPLTLGIIAFFTILYFLKRTDIGKESFLILAYLTVLSLAMVHFSELVFCAISMTPIALSLFCVPVVQIRLKDSLHASLLASLTLLGFLIYCGFVGIRVQLTVFDTAIPITLSATSILMVKLRQRLPNLTLRLSTVNTTHVYYIALGLSASWLAMLLYWFNHRDNFHVSMVSSFYGVPWILYPVLLGICGLLTYLGIFFMAKHHRNESAVIFLEIFVAGVISGRLLTYVNLNWFYTGYWERRFVPLTFSASTIIASLLVSHIFRKIQSRLISSLFLCLLMVTGLTSTALSIELQMLASQKAQLTSDELSHISLLSELNPNSYLLTYSVRSLNVAEYAPFAWRIKSFRDQIWPATSPELVLNALCSTGHPAVIYLSKEDYTQLSNAQFSQSYVRHHLLDTVPPLYKSAQSSIHVLQGIAPPTAKSNIVLVTLGNDSDANSIYAYDMISSAGYNYTTSPIFDVQTLSQAEIIVVPSEILALKVLELKNDLGLNFSKLAIFNLDGFYGELSQLRLPSINVALTSSDFGETILRAAADQQYGMPTNLSGRGFTPFVLETTASNNSLILADDEASGFWSASASSKGNLSLPRLSDDPDLKASGKDSLQIDVSEGGYAKWAISGEFVNATDLEAYDFMSFYWHGKGNGIRYVVQVKADTEGSYFWYEFADSWKGWKKVILPMHIADGSYTLCEVQFTKITRLARWNTVKKIDFRLSGKNLNIGGVFHLDRFAFEKSSTVNLKVTVHGNLEAFELLSLKGNTYIPIAQIDTDGTVPISEYYTSNELSSMIFLGEKTGDLAFTVFNDTYSEARIQIKVPINSSKFYPTLATFAVAPKYRMSKASSIGGEWRLILPTVIDVEPFETTANVTAYYDDEAKTFFAFKSSYNQVDLTYLNFHPIIDGIENGSTELYSIIGNATRLALDNLSSYTYRDEPINEHNTAAFREATLQGNVAVVFESIIIQTGTDRSSEVTIDRYPAHRVENNERISLTGFTNAVIETDYMKILPGNGFYIRALVQNAILRLHGNSTNLVSFRNDYSVGSLKGNLTTVEMGNVEVFMRKPLVSVDGHGSFKDTYTYGELNTRIRALAVECEISGRFAFTGIYGDTYTVTQDFGYVGNVKTSKPIYGYDEWQSIVEMLPYLVVIAGSLSVFELQRILRKRKKIA